MSVSQYPAFAQTIAFAQVAQDKVKIEADDYYSKIKNHADELKGTAFEDTTFSKDEHKKFLDDVTQQDVINYVKNNWNGKDQKWNTFLFLGAESKLMSEETRTNLATAMSNHIIDEYVGFIDHLPKVSCQLEADCRKRTFQEAVPGITEVWK